MQDRSAFFYKVTATAGRDHKPYRVYNYSLNYSRNNSRLQKPVGNLKKKYLKRLIVKIFLLSNSSCSHELLKVLKVQVPELNNRTTLSLFNPNFDTYLNLT